MNDEGANSSFIVHRSSFNTMEIRKGIGVSPGVVISTAVVLDAEDLVIPKRTIAPSEVRDEQERLGQALAQTVVDLAALRDEVTATHGKEIGNIFDFQGRQVSCEHLRRRVVRYENDGSVTVVADSYDGKRLNSPNDIVVKSDDSIWFTDPPFGILWNYEGHVDKPELPTNVYRIDGKTGELTVVTDEVPRPNGLCFSPDEKRLYVVVSGATPREIWVFEVVDNGTKLSDRRVFVNAAPGIPDGSCHKRHGWPGQARP